MSVLVKGMEMPESCIDCEIKQYDDYEDDCVCPFSGVVCLSIGRHDACPLVALPDHHGRLVDADALEKILEKIPAADIKNMGDQAYVLVKLSQVFNVIDNQPTIEPEPQWIPCSERLPEPRKAVLGYAPRYQNIYALYYDSAYGWMIWNPLRDDCFPNSQGEIVAWMPLPEAYREGES